MTVDTVYPRSNSDIRRVKPDDSLSRDVSRLQSEVNYLRSRIEKAERSATSVSVSGDAQEVVQSVINTAWTRDLIIAVVSGMDGTLLPVHYHSVLINPGTSNVAFQIDGDGGFIYSFTTMKLKVKISPVDSTRVWYAWNTATNGWSEIGDNFSVSL
jgi:hypothetical protein